MHSCFKLPIAITHVNGLPTSTSQTRVVDRDWAHGQPRANRVRLRTVLHQLQNHIVVVVKREALGVDRHGRAQAAYYVSDMLHLVTVFGNSLVDHLHQPLTQMAGQGFFGIQVRDDGHNVAYLVVRPAFETVHLYHIF